MSVRVSFELHIPGFKTVEDLQYYISLRDSLDDDEPIEAPYVKGSDVLQYYFLGLLPNIALDEGRIPTGYPQEVIVKDEMWEES